MAKANLFGPGCNLHRTTTVLLAALGVLTCTAFALALPPCGSPCCCSEGDTVLPPWACPYGYSLWDMAEETAAYNVGELMDPPVSEPLPDVPFEILVATIPEYTVKPGTMLYVPIFYADDTISPPSPPFPTDLWDQEADAEYLLECATVLTDEDTTAFIVQVDGKTTVLCDDYAVGVKTPQLPDGGHHYMVSAVFINPLTPGQHTIGIGGLIGGEPVVFVSYSVTVEERH